MINLSAVRNCMDTAARLVDELDGQELDERDAVTSQSKGDARRLRAQRSQDLQLLASRLELAASLVRKEYWFARGEIDPTNPDRED